MTSIKIQDNGKRNLYGLPELFLFDPNKESVDEYLTRASLWIDVIEHGNDEEKRTLAEQLGDISLSHDLKSYVFSVMNVILEWLGKSNYRKLVRENCYEEFMNEYRLLVWRFFYRFNNPKYKTDERTFRFSTFAIHYLKQAAWQVELHAYGVSDHTYRNCKKVKRAEEMLAKEDGIDHAQVRDLDIRQYIKSKEDIDISEEEIRSIRNILAPVSDVPTDYYKPVEDILFDDEKNNEVIEALEDFITSHHSLQIFVFLQNFGFCSGRYLNMTVQDLAKDPVFIRLCKSDITARKRIRSEKFDPTARYLKQSFSGKKPSEQLHLKEKYIFNMRLLMREEFTAYLYRKKLGPYDLRGNLKTVMFRAWEDLMLLYEMDGG